MNTDRTFADTLRSLRSEHGLLQKELADKLFVSRAAIASWESGRRLPDPILITRLAGVFGVDVSVIMNAAAIDPDPLNVIIVDDEELLLAGAIPTLSDALPGAEITGFSKVSEAVNFARSKRISLAFLDIELGKSSGLDLCNTLTEIYPLTNIVFLTSYPDYALKAWETQACGFLVKPLRVEAVKEQLTKLRHPIRGLSTQ